MTCKLGLFVLLIVLGGCFDLQDSNDSISGKEASKLEENDSQLNESGDEACPLNQIAVDEVCQCQVGLHKKDEYCIDWAETVIKGAEYLEVGFPQEVFLGGGTFFTPEYMKVGNIDSDPELEIIYKYGATPPVMAWNHDGSLVDGWPVWSDTNYYHGKIVLAQLDLDDELEVFIGHEGTAQTSSSCELNAYNADGSLLSGWPVKCGSSVTTVPVALDLNGDGIDEVIFDDQRGLHYIDATGKSTLIEHEEPLKAGMFNRLEWDGISTGNLDSDPENEFVIISEEFQYSDGLPYSTYIRKVYVLDSDFSVMEGSPVKIKGSRGSSPVIGDLDGDGNNEIAFFGTSNLERTIESGIFSSISIISVDGKLKNEIHFDKWIGDDFTDPLTLADLNSDSIPELLFYDDLSIHAIDMYGREIPGWPVSGFNAFAVGDVDGDKRPDLVTYVAYEEEEPEYKNRGKMKLAIYKDDGKIKDIEVSITPARDNGEMFSVIPIIRDIDLDGRNEVIVNGDYVGGVSGLFPQIWVFDFGGEDHGAVEWGQEFSDESNSNYYSPVYP